MGTGIFLRSLVMAVSALLSLTPANSSFLELEQILKKLFHGTDLKWSAKH